MITRTITVNLPTSSPTAPVALLVQIASQYESKIYIENSERKVNAKSIMGTMTLGLVPNEKVTVTAEGNDEETAIQKIAEYLTSK